MWKSYLAYSVAYESSPWKKWFNEIYSQGLAYYNKKSIP